MLNILNVLKVQKLRENFENEHFRPTIQQNRVQKRKLAHFVRVVQFTVFVYTILYRTQKHCPKNNLNLHMKTEPFTAAADATVQFCTVHVLLLFT